MVTSEGKPEPKFIEATKAHEMFYHDVMASAVTNKLQDRELIAILGMIIGRMVGGAELIGTESDRATLVDTAIYNMKLGRAEAGKLMNALGKGH